MALDPHAERFLAKLAAVDPSRAPSLTVHERRAALRQLLSFGGPREARGAIEDHAVSGPAGPVRLRSYAPALAAPALALAEPAAESLAPQRTAPQSGALPALLYFHGGGLCAGSLDTHEGICRSLADASGCCVISVDYRLAPEHRFPAAIEDGRAAAHWVAAHAESLNLDPGRLVIGGDSAGATLAAAVCQLTAATDTWRWALQFLLCPIMDFCADTESRRCFARGYLLEESTLQDDLRHYLPAGVDPADPRVSPLRAPQLGHLPPTCIHTAEFDPLRDEGKAYADRLRRAGVGTLYRCHSGMIHLFYGLGTLIPYAKVAFGLMGADIRSMLDRAP